MGGDISNNIQLLHEDKSVEEEVLPLCDLPLDSDTKTDPEPEPEPAFEFFPFRSNENGFFMCPADDIISGGKLVPLGEKTRRKDHVLRKRSESLSELRSSSSTGNGTALLRISRSLDSQKQKERVSPTKSSGQPDVSPKKAVKRPRWYVFMFGSVKFPPEMELQDIKSRQLRRNPSVMFSDDGKKVADNHRSSDKSSWSLLKALSCRGYTSVAVTSSFYFPQA
ncbi:hypothetical protein V6N13_004138 [Hibiscus sabdariffa]|uniref:Uncharacterized protein n=1 Tax=Hibiscus sabdariffa TaxID=183260 RepID=A0ABR2RXK5_9ROSI